jgi:hypothetical protein
MRGVERLEDEEGRLVEVGEETTPNMLQRLTAAPVTMATRLESEPMAVTVCPLTTKSND